MEFLSKLWGDNQPPTKTFDLIEINKEMKNLFHRKDKWRTWVIYKHHNSNNSQGKLLGKIQPKITPRDKKWGVEIIPEYRKYGILVFDRNTDPCSITNAWKIDVSGHCCQKVRNNYRDQDRDDLHHSFSINITEVPAVQLLPNMSCMKWTWSV